MSDDKQLSFDFTQEPPDTFPFTEEFKAEYCCEYANETIEQRYFRRVSLCWTHFIKNGGNVAEALEFARKNNIHA